MSTARTTPAQNPRGRTLSNTFPFVPVCIVILICYFRTLYHASCPRKLAPGFHPAYGSVSGTTSQGIGRQQTSQMITLSRSSIVDDVKRDNLTAQQLGGRTCRKKPANPSLTKNISSYYLLATWSRLVSALSIHCSVFYTCSWAS